MDNGQCHLRQWWHEDVNIVGVEEEHATTKSTAVLSSLDLDLSFIDISWPSNTFNFCHLFPQLELNPRFDRSG